MKNLKQQLLLLMTFLLIGCSSQQNSSSRPPAISPSTTPAEQTAPFLDFDNPRLHEIAGNKPLVIREIARSKYSDIPYVAIIIDTGDLMDGKKLLLFRLERTGSVLIYESNPYFYISFSVLAEQPGWLMDNTNYYFYRNTVGGIGKFGSGNLELPFEVSNGGNCYDCSEMRVIDITEDGIAKDVTPDTNFTPKAFIDLSEQINLPFYIIATRYYEWGYGAQGHPESPYAFRLYSWNGTAYTDVSKDHQDFYDKDIAGLVNNIKNSYGKPFVSDPIMPMVSEIFFDYESSGRIDYGWEQIKSLGDLSHWDIKNTPPEEIQSYHQVFDELEQRKNNDNATSTP